MMTAENSSFDPVNDSGPQSLGILLRALLGYSENSLRTASEAEGMVAPKRDFAGEALIVHALLLHCCQLLLRLSESEVEALVKEHATVNTRPDSAAVDEFAPGPRGETNALWEVLRDATHLLEAMVASPPITLQAWASFNNVLARDLNNSITARRLTARAASNQLPPVISSLTEPVAAETLGADLRAIFSTLSQQLNALSLIESTMKARQPLKPLLPVFMLIWADTSALLEHLEKRTLREPNTEKKIVEALDGTAYAIRMELRKTFEHELAGVIEGRQPHHLYAKMENAHGLLRDCFQQSILGLAQLFDPELQGARLFGHFQAKLDQSLSLRRELWRLLRTVRRAVESRVELNPSAILEIINTFREESLRLLMYKDRESFERFYEEIESTGARPQIVHVLHRFEAYLETLFTQVNMRAVLTDYPFDAGEIE